MNNVNAFEDEISLVDILKFFLKHFRLITIFTLLFFVIGVILFLFVCPPKGYYIAESAIIVLDAKTEFNIETKTSLLGVKELVDLLGVKELADIYLRRLEDRKKTVTEIIKSPVIISSVLKKAKEQLQRRNLKITLESFVSTKSDLLEVRQIGEIIKIKVKLPDKELAKFFADEIAKTTLDFVRKELYFDLPQQQEKLVKIAYLSVLPEKPQDGKKNYILIFVLTLIGFFVGIFAGAVKDVYIKIKSEV